MDAPPAGFCHMDVERIERLERLLMRIGQRLENDLAVGRPGD